MRCRSVLPPISPEHLVPHAGGLAEGDCLCAAFRNEATQYRAISIRPEAFEFCISIPDAVSKPAPRLDRQCSRDLDGQPKG